MDNSNLIVRGMQRGYTSTSIEQQYTQTGVLTWLDPISSMDFSPGNTWSNGPDGPIGDPPIQLRSLSVSEGTL